MHFVKGYSVHSYEEHYPIAAKHAKLGTKSPFGALWFSQQQVRKLILRLSAGAFLSFIYFG